MLLYLLAVAAQDPRLIAHHPVPATPWSETFTARCGRDELQILRPLYPLGNRPTLLINRQPAGGNLSDLIADLSEVRAAYRFSFLCSQSRTAMQLRWVRGLAYQGRVTYRAGSANFRDGALTSSRSHEVNESTFWYR